MAKMSPQQSQKVGSRVSMVVLNSKSVTFRCKSNADGKTVRDIIQAAFHPKSVTRYNYDLEIFFTVGMSEWKEFRAKFDSSSDAEDCFNEVEAAVVAYQNSESDYPISGGTGGGTGGGFVSGVGDDVGTGSANGSKSWILYLAIGVAAVAVIMLLWNRKKK